MACAGEMCRHDILTAEAAAPIILYGTRIEPVPDRVGDLRIYMDEAGCTSMGQPAGCALRSRWMMQTFGTVGLE